MCVRRASCKFCTVELIVGCLRNQQQQGNTQRGSNVFASLARTSRPNYILRPDEMGIRTYSKDNIKSFDSLAFDSITKIPLYTCICMYVCIDVCMYMLQLICIIR